MKSVFFFSVIYSILAPQNCDKYSFNMHWFLSLVQFCSVTQLCPTVCDPMNHSTPSSPIHHQLPEFSLLKLMSIESVMPSIHLIFCRLLLLLPPIPLSIRIFYNDSTLCMRWPKYWSFSFNINPSSEHPELMLLNCGVGEDS